MNEMTVFRNVMVDGIEISFIDREDDEILIHSIIDPERDGAIRVTKSGVAIMEDDDENGPLPNGLIVFGSYKWDRFYMEEVVEEYPEYTDAMEAVRKKVAGYRAAQILGKIGGSSRSDRKAASSRENGKKGGRRKSKES